MLRISLTLLQVKDYGKRFLTKVKVERNYTRDTSIMVTPRANYDNKGL